MKTMSNNRKYHPFLRHAVLAALALTMGTVTAEADGGVITAQTVDPGTYDSIQREVDRTSEEGLILSGGIYKVAHGGIIQVNKQSTTAYGIKVTQGDAEKTGLTVGGKLTVAVDNTKSSAMDDRVMGIWAYGGYNPYPDTDGSLPQPEDASSFVALGEADITARGHANAYGLLAGFDFEENNSVGGGYIVADGNMRVAVSTVVGEVEKSEKRRALGAVALNGGIALRGPQNQFTVSGAGDGGTGHQIAGFYTSRGGWIKAEENSHVSLTVSGQKVYGICAGYEDYTYADKRGKGGVTLLGKTTINLGDDYSGENTNVGVAAYAKSRIQINDLTINFNNLQAASNTGLSTHGDGIIEVDSLYIGTGNSRVQDPTKIIAIAAESKSREGGGGQTVGDSSGEIWVNKDKKGTVQVVGTVKALESYEKENKGVHLLLTNANSYLYGNTVLHGTWVGDERDGQIFLTVENGAKWINVQDADDADSKLTTLTMNGGMVDMTDTAYTDTVRHPFQKIYVNKTFDGNGGGFRMDIDASTHTDNSDRVYVGTHTGTHSIWLNNVNADNITDGAEGTVLVSVKDEQGKFIAEDSEGTLYWNKYTLDNKINYKSDYRTDWYLAAVDTVDPGEKPTTSVETALSAGSLNYFMWRDSDKLMRRMGDLRHNGEEEKGLWFRMKGTEMSYDGSAFGFKDKYLLYQLGYDKLAEKDERRTRYEGIAFSYGDGESSYHRGSGDNDSYDLSLYRTDMRSKGHYLDLVLKGSRLSNDFHAFDTEGRKISGSNDNWGLSVSAEYGRKKVLDDNGWYIEPQTQLTFGYLWGDDYTLSNGVRVEQDGMTSLVGRAGFNLGRDIDEKTNVYVKLNVLHEFLGDYDFHMSDAAGNRLRYDGDFGDTWLEYGIGAAIRVDDDTHIYFDYERSTGGDFRTNWSWNAGIRWNF